LIGNVISHVIYDKMSEELSLQNNEFYAEESGMDIIG